MIKEFFKNNHVKRILMTGERIESNNDRYMILTKVMNQ